MKENPMVVPEELNQCLSDWGYPYIPLYASTILEVKYYLMNCNIN